MPLRRARPRPSVPSITRAASFTHCLSVAPSAYHITANGLMGGGGRQRGTDGHSWGNGVGFIQTFHNLFNLERPPLTGLITSFNWPGRGGQRRHSVLRCHHIIMTYASAAWQAGRSQLAINFHNHLDDANIGGASAGLGGRRETRPRVRLGSGSGLRGRRQARRGPTDGNFHKLGGKRKRLRTKRWSRMNVFK